MVSSTPKETLDSLFPVPEALTGIDNLRPAWAPGISNDSGETLVKLLKDNHERFHIFFNDRNFHNHCSHHLYAIYALGASPRVLEAAYETFPAYQRKAVEPPEEITESNWTEHFGDERYFRAYVSFFAKIYTKVGLDAVLDKYVFSTSANWVDLIKDDKKQPQMVNRLLSGVLHPLIHVGYGIEFSSPGMVAEGLAMACVQKATDFDVYLPRSAFAEKSLSSHLSSTLSMSAKSAGVHSFSIVAQMLKDLELSPGSASAVPPIMKSSKEEGGEGRAFPMVEILEKRGELIKKYAEQWVVNVNDRAEVKAKVEELFVLATLLYGIAGLQKGRDFNADFFTMHLVTSVHFLPSFIEHLTPTAQSMLLYTNLAIALSVWIARGRPAVHIANFYEKTSPDIIAPGPKPTPGKGVVAPDALTPNAWFAILQSTLLHPNEHLSKIQRALFHFAQVYGGRPAGFWKGTELEDSELLDGTVFVRVAALTMNKLRWIREGQDERTWDRSGFWD